MVRWRSGFCVFMVLAASWTSPVSAEPVFETKRGVVYAQRGDLALKADVYVPAQEGTFPGVLVVHGGAWAAGERTQLRSIAELLAANGYTAVAISYRLAPQHLFPAQLEDCQDAIRWMREQATQYKIDPTRIGGFGYSAGGHLVTLLGTLSDETDAPRAEAAAEKREVSARLQAVVAGGAPCDFRVLPAHSRMLAYWLGGSRAEKPEVYTLASPANFVSRDDPPMFFYHGDEDSLVPLLSPMAMNVLLKLAGVPSQVYTIAGAGHIAAVRDKAALDAALQFLNQHLKNESSELTQ